jgi:ATP-binding cassette subfamily B protein
MIADPATFFVPPYTAYTPQVPHLFSDTLRDNLLMGLEGVRVEDAIHAAVMESDIASMEDGLETHIGSRGVRLSGGQLQRAAAARMFVREPQLLVIDDLSSALDVDTERVLWERLLARPQTTCLIVTHRPIILNHADRVIWLEEGRAREIRRWGEIAKGDEAL